jgi:superfamily II DNA or RNA helicase
MLRLAAASTKRKEIRALLEEWAEEQALALVFRWFLDHGNEIAARLTSPPSVIELPAGKPGPQTVEDFRETLKKLLESA